MNEFVVKYRIDKSHSDDIGIEEIQRSLVVKAEDRVDAFVTAYDHFTRSGHRVVTFFFSNKWSRGEGESNPLEFTDEDVHRIREAGVELDSSPRLRGLHIDSIKPYTPKPKGSVITAS